MTSNTPWDHTWDMEIEDAPTPFEVVGSATLVIEHDLDGEVCTHGPSPVVDDDEHCAAGWRVSEVWAAPVPAAEAREHVSVPRGRHVSPLSDTVDQAYGAQHYQPRHRASLDFGFSIAAF